MKVAIVIPAQKTNKYHIKGDMAPFGDTTLFEWKVSQCMECCSVSEIFITTDSLEAQEIAKNNGINVLFRSEEITYSEMLLNIVAEINFDHIMWVNTTSPFINANEYRKMLKTYSMHLDKNDSLITTSMKKDFIYYDEKKLNFDKHSDGRTIVKPIFLATNGVYINSKENILKNQDLIGDKPFFYNLDFLESLEIKDMHTYAILNELISLYFKKELDV